MDLNPHLKSLSLSELFTLSGSIHTEIFQRLNRDERLDAIAPLTGEEVDALVALVERGPVESGSIPSKSARAALVRRGLAVFVSVRMEQGYTAATPAGELVYKHIFTDLEGNPAETLMKVRANRVRMRTMKSLQHPPRK